MAYSRAGGFAAALALSVFAGSSPTHAGEAGASTPPVETLIAREVAALELVGGVPLTADERQQAANAVASGLRGNSEVWFRDSATWLKPLARAGGDRTYSAALRRTIRLDVEQAKPAPPGLEEAYAIERAIIHANDPTIVFDARRSHIITAQSLRELREAVQWFAVTAGLPGPSADFTDNVGTWLKDNYSGLDDSLAKALANANENFTVTPNLFAKINGKDREAHLKQVRDQIQATEGPLRDVSQAIAVAFLAQLCAQEMQKQAKSHGKGHGLPVDRYWQIARTAILGGVTVHGLNMHGPFSR